MDYYQILGVSKTASDAELKTAYRKKALEWHPDRNKNPGAAEKFKEVNEAYEVLSNSQKRQTYDQYGTAGPQGNPFGGFNQQGPFNYSYQSYGSDFSDPFEIFEQFFGGGFSSARGGPRRARRSVYSLEITFMEAVKGAEKEVEINGKNMKIKIPAGVDEGTRVRFGDFDIVISVATDKTFRREGSNIYVTTEIDYPSAVLGTTITVPTIDGEVTLKVPTGTQPDTLIRLKGRGVSGGDQYVRIKIKVPSKVTGPQRELLEELRKSSPQKRSGWF